MVELSAVELHLLGLLMGTAVLVDNSRRKIIECFSVPVAPRHHKFHRVRKLPANYFHKCLIVVSRECHIGIVIPRDKPFVAHSSEKRARIQHVSNLIFSANPIDLLENLQICLMHSGQIIFHIVSLRSLLYFCASSASLIVSAI